MKPLISKKFGEAVQILDFVWASDPDLCGTVIVIVCDSDGNVFMRDLQDIKIVNVSRELLEANS